MKFRKKPVVIDAITFDELADHAAAAGAYGDAVFAYAGHPVSRSGDGFLIPTLEGPLLMPRGSMLITGVKGEIYPCRGDIFAATYDSEPTQVA